MFDDVVTDESDDDDFTHDLPLNMSDDEVKGLLFAYPAEPLAYDDWLKVGQALHHQYLGGDVGFDLWVAWSALSSKHDARMMRKKYNSFGKWKVRVLQWHRLPGTLSNKAVSLLRCLIRYGLRRKVRKDIAIT